MSVESRTPLAIVGIGCRFPSAHGPLEFWRTLCAGRDAVGEMPADRLAACGLRREALDEAYLKGGFLSGIDLFDPEFFGVTPREAHRMDPQQRLLLETVWEALEDAGQDPRALAGTRTGVFIGQMGADYWELMRRNASVDMHGLLSSARSMLSGRLSHSFDFRGPSMSLDTGCSSSLLAVQLACESLRSGQATTALAGGVNLILAPHSLPGLSRVGVLSPDGRCKFGDASADGYVRSEGVGLVVLKRLDDAIAADDRIYAVIMGASANNDGGSGVSSGRPAVQGQREVLSNALLDAKITPADVDYVEAHGAGTAVGDPAEFEALGAVLGRGRREPFLVGSVKTNIGHTESAAGVAALIKAALCLHHGMVPPNLHFSTPNPAIDWDGLPVTVPTTLTPLPERDRPWHAGVTSLGISGTNVHVVLAQAPPRVPRSTSDAERVLALSAHTPGALLDLAEEYADYLAKEDFPLGDVCHSASARRHAHDHRVAVTGSSAAELAEKIKTARPVKAQPGAKLAFVFSGQGSQWPGMAKDLLVASPVFRAVLEECDEAVHKEHGWSILQQLNGQPMESADVVQPVLWAVQAGLAAVWQSRGVQPDLVIGHSMGEVAAAQVAGALSVTDAAAVICHRSRLATTATGGGMASVALPEAELEEFLVGRDVWVAAANGPHSTTMSGDVRALREVVESLQAKGVFCRLLDVGFAAHSPLVQPLRDELVSRLADISPVDGVVPFRSTVLGEIVDGSTLDARYWARNFREPVRFADAVAATPDPVIFVEISPHPVLLPAIEDAGRTAIGSLRRNESGQSAMLGAFGSLWTLGGDVDWREPGARLVTLPPYRWDRESYWILPRAVEAPAHPLLGEEGPERVWEGPISLDRNPYLVDHQVQGVAILPGSGYCELTVAAVRRAFGERPFQFSGVTIRQPLVLDRERVVRVSLLQGVDSCAVEIGSRAGGDVITHATGEIRLGPVPRAPVEPLDAIRGRCATHLPSTDFYRRITDAGNQWEARFQAVTEAWLGDGEVLARITCPDTLTTSGFHFHPVLLDACGQALAGAADRLAGAFVLSAIATGRVHHLPGAQLWAHAKLGPSQPGDGVLGDITVFGPDGGLLVDLLGVRLKYVSTPAAESDVDDWLHEVVWQRARVPDPALAPGNWVVLGSGRIGGELRDLLARDGHRVLTSLSDDVPLHGVVDLRGPDLPGVVGLVRQLAGRTRLWLVTSGAQEIPGDRDVSPHQAMLWGLGRTLAQEHPRLRPVLADTDNAVALYRELIANSDEDQVALRGAARYVARLARYAVPETAVPHRMTAKSRGTLDALVAEDLPDRGPGSGEVAISTAYAALNYGDMLRLMGLDPAPEESMPDPGVECVGTVVETGQLVPGLRPGDEVIAIGTLGLSSRTIAKVPLVFKIPAGVALADAATMPIALLTAYYSLHTLASTQPGERVLIHTGTGGVGLAAIQVARWRGAEIYATAGSPEKRALLRTMGIKHVADSRSLDFAEVFRAATHGAGVDVVLNTLTGDAIQKNLELLRPGGRYVELTKRDIVDGGRIALRDLAHNISFHVVDLESMWRVDPDKVAGLMRSVLDRVAAGDFAPLPSQTFPARQAPAAFRLMARAGHVGKILLEFDQSAAADHAPLIRPDATYLVTGGLGGIGREVTDWLLASGARHVQLVGRSPAGATDPRTHYQSADVADESAMRGVLAGIEARGWPGVRGVFHAAGLMDYGPLVEATFDVVRPKVQGTQVLDRLLPDLDFLALFSSGSTVLGSPLIAGYAAANAYLDAFARRRRLQGKPATSIGWGFWSQTGMAARQASQWQRTLPTGMGGVTTRAGISILERLLRARAGHVVVLPVNWAQWADAHPQAAQSPILRGLVHAPQPVAVAAPVPARADVAQLLVEYTAQVLGTTVDRVSRDQPLTRTGMDSLMAMELRNRVERDLGVTVPVVNLLGGCTLNDVIAQLSDAPELG
ncbi:type I polyketide synthase [Kibdelosporangium phytohabitans]|uniref:Uncharacterized protein n=1 Tax=Kibdelosporangium phytohabitans TaxID=860235 RepID=A0A0N9HY98_9PSEU|nr:type I polyketide synthase [Kibdelosporangium phytohabitans]ALG08297.1 hypothetical protein AOZ06_16505 [Kibdelosporangium phytohabitans]MBE1470678.1 epothilone polyketide synthase D [Kibdelosporangium phytohabitans]